MASSAFSSARGRGLAGDVVGVARLLRLFLMFLVGVVSVMSVVFAAMLLASCLVGLCCLGLSAMSSLWVTAVSCRLHAE